MKSIEIPNVEKQPISCLEFQNILFFFKNLILFIYLF